jgi:DNA-binding HxlR family transcriptional regulator
LATQYLLVTFAENSIAMADIKAERSKQPNPLSSPKWASGEERTRSEYLTCPIRHVVSRFGDKWSLLVLFLLNRSETGVMRFNEIRRYMTDCSQKMLSQTLKNLEQSHLVHRQVYAEVPPRVEYSLTETSRSLMPALDALIDWGKQHFNEVVTD